MDEKNFWNLIRAARKKVAGLILGDQLALFMPQRYAGVLERGCYEDLSNEQLGIATRYWFRAIRRAEMKLAGKRGIPLSVFCTSQAVMTLIRYATETNASGLEIAQNGCIGGQKTGNWLVTVSRLPDDYEFGRLGIQEEIYDGDKLTKLALGFSFAGDPQ